MPTPREICEEITTLRRELNELFDRYSEKLGVTHGENNAAHAAPVDPPRDLHG